VSRLGWTGAEQNADPFALVGSMSNSSYPRALDSARFKWLIEVVGPAMGVEKIWSPLAQTAFWFKSEIPAFAAYEIDVHVTAWDDKWVSHAQSFYTSCAD